MRQIYSIVQTVALTLLIGSAACAKEKGSGNDDSTNSPVTVISSGGVSTRGNGTTADSQASTGTKDVYAFLKGLPVVGDTRRLVIGQQSNNAKYYAEGYTTYVEGLQALTGKWPAILGADDDMGLPQNSTLLDLSGVNQMLIDYWQAGGRASHRHVDCTQSVERFGCVGNSVAASRLA